MAERKTVLIFDSGLGGLTVYREVAAARADADFLYVADDAAFPYGALAEPALISRVVALMDELIAAHRPDLVVIACNTASTIVLAELRKKFTVPFVGTVPAIKPACAASVTRRVSVLGTEATVQREYTRALIRDYAQDCQVTLVGSKKLAGYAEDELAGAPVGRRRAARRNRARFRRRRQTHRHHRARVHALSTADRALADSLRPGRSILSIRRRRSRGEWSICSGHRQQRPARGRRTPFSPRAAHLKRFSHASASIRPRWQLHRPAELPNFRSSLHRISALLGVQFCDAAGLVADVGSSDRKAKP